MIWAWLAGLFPHNVSLSSDPASLQAILRRPLGLRRRALLGGVGCCGCLSAAWPLTALAQGPSGNALESPQRPALDSEEGGLWGLMDREESRLKRSAFLVRDAQLQTYLGEVMQRLSPPLAAAMRLYVVRQPSFNAVVAPNGMLQVWTGLLLRLENEAQLAAVLGHEMGHFAQRHALQRLQSAKSSSAGATLLLAFGLVGALGALAVAAGHAAYNRSQENEADETGLGVMRRHGYDTRQAPLLWENLKAELDASAGKQSDPAANNALFATHPGVEERAQRLRELTANDTQGRDNNERYLQAIAPLMPALIDDELKRAMYDQTIVLMTRLMKSSPRRADLVTARGDAFRLRNETEDGNRAMADYEVAMKLDAPPATLWRSVGYLRRAWGHRREALEAFQTYLQHATSPPDAALIQDHIDKLQGAPS